MRPTSPAFAVIDGTLFQLTREGAVARSCAPLATAIEEFLCGPLCVFVRERPHGLLPGISNLYKLDAALRLEWLAAWPGEYGACTQIIEIVNDVLIAASASGALVRLDIHDGRILEVDRALAATG